MRRAGVLDDSAATPCGDEIPEHLGGDSTLWHRTGSAQVSELVVHPRVEWFEVGGQGCRERAGCKARGGPKGGKRVAQSRLHGGSGLNEYPRAREMGQQQQGQVWVGLWQMDRQEPERAVQEYRRPADVLQWYSG